MRVWIETDDGSPGEIAHHVVLNFPGSPSEHVDGPHIQFGAYTGQIEYSGHGAIGRMEGHGGAYQGS